jgi:hypothetical protein
MEDPMCRCGEHSHDASASPATMPDGGGEASGPVLTRRGFLSAATVMGMAGAATLAPVEFASAAGTSPQTRTITGHFDIGVPDFVYLPVQVPRGVRQLDVSYSYDRPATPPGVLGNALDIGIFDQRGHQLGDRAGFRGWSGGFRTSFSISNSEATPGYLPGAIRQGTWYVVLGPYTVAPAGLNWTVQITLHFGDQGPAFVPDYPPSRAKGRGRAWYRGDAHLHTVYSDGRRLPAEVAAGARARGLDFIVSTEHNTSSSHGVWGPLAGDDLLILAGEEITTRNGHFVAAGLTPGDWIDWRYRARDGELPRFLRDIHEDGAIAVAAHPFAPCLACAWKFGYEGMDAVEVWNGPWTLDDELAVQLWNGMLVQAGRGGRWLPAMGNSDAHNEPQVIGLPHNVVLADDLSRREVVEGLREGRTWIAESSDIDLTFTVTGGGKTAGIGGRLPVSSSELVTATLEVSGVPNATVLFVSDEGQTHAAVLPASGTGTVRWQTTPAVSAYVRAEVRHPGGNPAAGIPGPMAALTNPIFLGRA